MTSNQSAHDHLAGAKLLSLPTPRFKVHNEYDGGSVHGVHDRTTWDALPKADEVDVIVSGSGAGSNDQLGPSGPSSRGANDGASPPQLQSTVSARSQGSLVTSDPADKGGSRPQSRQAADQPPRRRHLWPEDICAETAGLTQGSGSQRGSHEGGASSGKGRRRKRADSYGNHAVYIPVPGQPGPIPSSTSQDKFPTARSDYHSSGGAESPQPQHSGSISERAGESPVPVHRHDSAGSAAWVATQGQLQRDAQTPSPPVDGDDGSSRRHGLAAGSEYSQLQLPLISATPYAESVPLEKGEDNFVDPVSDRQQPRYRKCILFFLIASIVSGLAGLALYAAIPRNKGTNDVFKPSCNVTAAVHCSAELGEWDNLCDALLSGEQDARPQCCRSPVALSCWHRAFCAIDCPATASPNTARLDTAANWTNPQDLAKEVANQLNLSIGLVSAELQPCNETWCRRHNGEHDVDTATVTFCKKGECSPKAAAEGVLQLLREAGGRDDPIRSALDVYSVPWAVGPDPEYNEPMSLLQNSYFDVTPTSGESDWKISGGNCTALQAPQQCYNNSMTCVLCRGPAVSLSQYVTVDAYPEGTQWTLLGWFSLVGSSGRSSEPLVTVDWCSDDKCAESEVVVTANPWGTGYLHPRYLPFVWIGKRPKWATRARLSLRCTTNGADTCQIYFDHPVFTPGSPPCNEREGCIPTRCQGGVNTTHDVCQSARTCTDRSASPYEYGLDLTMINGSTLWPGFYFKPYPDENKGAALIGGTISGHILGKDPPPDTIQVYERLVRDGNDTGKVVPVGCRDIPGMHAPPCKTIHMSFKPSFFSYTYFFAVNSSDIPQKVFTWRLKDDSGAVCVDVSWFVAPQKQHVMDITVDPTSTSMHRAEHQRVLVPPHDANRGLIVPPPS